MFDVASTHYDAENKNTVVPAALWKAWKQVVAIAAAHDKEPLLRLEPSNPDKKGVPIIHMITEERHEKLLTYERAYDAYDLDWMEERDAWEYVIVLIKDLMVDVVRSHIFLDTLYGLIYSSHSFRRYRFQFNVLTAKHGSSMNTDVKQP